MNYYISVVPLGARPPKTVKFKKLKRGGANEISSQNKVIPDTY
jgi:hypothetical protein